MSKAQCSGRRMYFCWRRGMGEASRTGSQWAWWEPPAWMLWDVRVKHRPPGLRGTPWDTGPAAGTWASPPDPKPSNKPSQQICRVTEMVQWWCSTPNVLVDLMPVTFSVTHGHGEDDILKIYRHYYLLGTLKWKEAKRSYVNFICRFQFFIRAYQNVSANTEISWKYLCYPVFMFWEKEPWGRGSFS